MPPKRIIMNNGDSGQRVPVKIWTDDVEREAAEQLVNLAKLPFVFKHVAAMPDVHAGKGSTVGTVLATEGAIIPAAVGVDIGCGMMAVKTNLTWTKWFDGDLSGLRGAIEAAVPVGFKDNGDNRDLRAEIEFFGETPASVSLKADPALIVKAQKQLGSLGGGNHFIELCIDENQQVWVMLHSGSRGVGNMMAVKHMKVAKELMKKWYVTLDDPDLAYLPEGTPEFDAYMDDLRWGQAYAWANRKEMMRRVLAVLDKYAAGVTEELVVHCHHNYTSRENHFGRNVWLTRKGAISAREGQLGIIPGSMGAKSYIVSGLGNPDSFTSASHGAGRRMSRTEAKRQFTQADLHAQTQGVECRKDADVIDEIPGAYKDIDAVMENQKDLVMPVHTLKQFLCVKG